jgi:phage gpG-like protein
MNGIKKFNWVRRPSTWESMQAWKTQRAEMAAKFIEQQAAAVNAFASAHSNNTAGLVANAQQAAINRLRAASRVNTVA